MVALPWRGGRKEKSCKGVVALSRELLSYFEESFKILLEPFKNDRHYPKTILA